MRLGRSREPEEREDTVLWTVSSLQAQLLSVLGFLWGPIANALSLICMLEMLLQRDVSCKQHKIRKKLLMPGEFNFDAYF